MSKIQPWATHICHDGPMEHWRVTALLSKVAFRVCQVLTDLSSEEREKLPEALQKLIPIIYRQVEVTDFFLSGMIEGSKPNKED